MFLGVGYHKFNGNHNTWIAHYSTLIIPWTNLNGPIKADERKKKVTNMHYALDDLLKPCKLYVEHVGIYIPNG